MATQSEQFIELITGKTEYRDCNIRSVDNGFIITGQRRWLEPETFVAVAQLQAETIAEDHSSASARVTKFLATGAFV